MGTVTGYASQRPVVVSGSTRNCIIGYPASLLAASETISSITSITDPDGSGLSVSSTAVTEEETRIDGVAFSAGKAISFKVTGFDPDASGGKQRLKATVATSGGQVLVTYLWFQVPI